jgi:hypothetical protein
VDKPILVPRGLRFRELLMFQINADILTAGYLTLQRLGEKRAAIVCSLAAIVSTNATNHQSFVQHEQLHVIFCLSEGMNNVF